MNLHTCVYLSVQGPLCCAHCCSSYMDMSVFTCLSQAMSSFHCDNVPSSKPMGDPTFRTEAQWP